MTPTNLFNRYLWLVELLSYNKRLSKDEIDEYWKKSALNDNPDKDKGLPRRTFIRMKESIESLFDLHIKYSRKEDKYYVAEDKTDRNKSMRKYLLSAFSVNHLLRENKELMPRILMDNVSVGGGTLLPNITTAMRDNRRITIAYQSYEMQQVREFDVEPYALRYANHRWYLLAHTDFHHDLRLYALDRMSAVTITDFHFKLPKDFDATDYFSHFFGAMIIDAKSESVQLKANEFRAPYLRSLPLHHSQKEISPGVFELRLVITEDFVQALRSLGPDVEVTRPKWLREQLRDEARMLAKRYSRKL